MGLIRILAFLLLSLQAIAVQASQCIPTQFDETVTLDYVNDGDTITLTDGRLVRLIGIDSPEIDFQFPELSQSYATPAKKYLSEVVKPGQSLLLAFDKQRLGPYGRTLAYVYTEKLEHLQEMMLSHGFAKARVYQNDYFWQCLSKIERTARERKVGLWSDKSYQPLTTDSLTRDDSNKWREVRGVVTGYERKGQNFELNIDNNLVVMMSQQDIGKFSNILTLKLLESRVIVRGKLYFSYGKYRLNATHPSQITMENTP
ncbi:nuclease (SNase domain protein) [Shewanella halifaxensis HAW-EB4]|uniref:Nuclease (SNase domain protein) n=1 Tax=Shewanella halifaxensis (strain HAW-EB4) TaxID=458817 RepID=B0TVU7_SHEHH|nr:thermonuclease family protein [Shewanella halifaxensis]ABZ78400.1 nuclease (SNase domain protein) [Shewanella halifaxensis HAW-EB4]